MEAFNEIYEVHYPQEVPLIETLETLTALFQTLQSRLKSILDLIFFFIKPYWKSFIKMETLTQGLFLWIFRNY